MTRERIIKRIEELQTHQASVQSRAATEVADAQRQIDALTSALDMLTPQVEQVFDTLLLMRLIPTKE